MHSGVFDPLDRSILEWSIWKAYSYGWKDLLKELSFKPVVQLDSIEVGLCTWSCASLNGRDLSEIVAYARASGRDAAPLVTEASSTNDQIRFEEQLISLPKEHCWHRRKFRKELVEVMLRPEDALQKVQEWAERRVGITQQQQQLLGSAVETAKFRHTAMVQLQQTPLEDWQARFVEGMVQAPQGA